MDDNKILLSVIKYGQQHCMFAFSIFICFCSTFEPNWKVFFLVLFDGIMYTRKHGLSFLLQFCLQTVQ